MTVRQKVGWKVLTAGRYSCTVNKGLRLYKRKRKTIPYFGYGPLCIFTNVYSAWFFAKSSDQCLIVVKCLYKSSEHTHVWNADNKQSLCILPPNTALADSVTCLE